MSLVSYIPSVQFVTAATLMYVLFYRLARCGVVVRSWTSDSQLAALTGLSPTRTAIE